MTRCLIFEDVHRSLKMYILKMYIFSRAWEDNVHVLLLFLGSKTRDAHVHLQIQTLKMYISRGATRARTRERLRMVAA